jgi:glycosyltransferase involved in cell wall biosynthesis
MSRAITLLAAMRDRARATPWLHETYRLLPQGMRRWASQSIASLLSGQARFAPLPAVEVAAVDRLGAYLESSLQCTERGVNLFAYFRGQFGLAEAARLYATALAREGYPVSLIDIDLDLPHGFDDQRMSAALTLQAPFPVSIFFVNPDYFSTALDRIGRAQLEGKHLIACWFWELERVPDEWLPALDLVDEIMVASTFVEQAFRLVTDKPVIKVPLPLMDDSDSGVDRQAFGISDQDFVYLASFDFHSWAQRKNPSSTIEAFRKAFPDAAAPVKLVLKTSNGERHPEAFADLLRMAASDRRIMVRDGVVDHAHVRSLQRCCDAYVSLHRAEGFGLGLAECMHQGKPVIATGWSGNMDFMTPHNSIPVRYRMVDVPPGAYLHGVGQRWADADVDEAAAAMRRLFDDRDFAAELGRRASDDVRRLLSPRRAAAIMIERLDAIRLDRFGADREHQAKVGEGT